MFLSMAATINMARSIDEILEDIRSQVRVLLPH
jgi:TetR/AcrR family transcriptional regulator